jgi:Fic family protein
MSKLTKTNENERVDGVTNSVQRSMGNGRMGRLWQGLILSKWQPIFGFLPVETIIHKRQRQYYAALNACNKSGDSTVFIEFMLGAIKASMEEVVS